jgi:hypothetical protein
VVAPSAARSSGSLWKPLPRTLLALTLLLTATHCVEIDDRDLEEHPAGGDVCGITSSDTQCGACLKNSCCSELTDCAASYDCQYFIICYDSCTDQPCVDLCVAAFPDGATIYESALRCGEDNCLAECPNDAG